MRIAGSIGRIVGLDVHPTRADAGWEQQDLAASAVGRRRKRCKQISQGAPVAAVGAWAAIAAAQPNAQWLE
jgi:hypothetical protein